MVEPRDDFDTTDDALEEDFEDAEGSDELGFDADEAIAQIDENESDVSEQFRGLV